MSKEVSLRPPTQPGSRITGALIGAAAGAILPGGPVTAIAGAVVGGVFGPKSKLINTAADKGLKRLGNWTGNKRV